MTMLDDHGGERDAYAPTQPGAARSSVAMPGSAEPWPSDDISFWALASLALRYRRVALGVALPIFIVGVVVVLFAARKPTYTSVASFAPQRSNNTSNLSGLAGIAAQYGVSLDEESGENPEFYAALLRSRRLLSAVVESPYRFQRGNAEWAGTLIDLYGTRKKSRAIAKESALKQLRRDIDVSVARTTGIVEVAVNAEHPELARQIANHLIAHLNRFNQTTRQTRAAAERAFVEDRLKQKRTELARFEAEFEEFLKRNRQFRNSPELTFSHERYQREMSLQQEVVTSLTESFEKARIEEVRNTPVITIVETPERAVLPNPRGRTKKTLFVLFLAALAGVSAALITAWLHGRRSDRSEFNKGVNSELREVIPPGTRSAPHGSTSLPTEIAAGR